MKQRVLRALQRGGVTARHRRDEWAVWRCRDRRRRIIGTLLGAEVDVLRLNDCLVSEARGRSERLVWNTELSGSARPETERELMGLSQMEERALDALILTWKDPIERGRVVDLILSLRRAPELWAILGSDLSRADIAFLERLFAWPKTKQAFAVSKGLSLRALDRRSKMILKAALRIESDRLLVSRGR